VADLVSNVDLQGGLGEISPGLEGERPTKGPILGNLWYISGRELPTLQGLPRADRPQDLPLDGEMIYTHLKSWSIVLKAKNSLIYSVWNDLKHSNTPKHSYIWEQALFNV